MPIRWPGQWRWRSPRPASHRPPGWIAVRPDRQVAAGEQAVAAALRASEAKFAAAFALSPLALSITVLPSGQFVEVNEALIRLIGYSREELLGHTPIELGIWADEVAWLRGREVLAREGRIPQSEARFRRKDGVIIVGLASAERIVVDGQPAILTVLTDITEFKQTEEVSRRSEERYRALFDSIDQGCCLFEMLYGADGRPYDYRFLEVNPPFERHSGLKDAVGKTARELVPDLEDHWIAVYARVAETGERHRFEQGSAALGRWFEVDAVRVGGAGSRQVALLFTDVTERKRAEVALQTSARRAAFRAALGDALRPLADSAVIQAEAVRLLGEHLGVSRAFYAAVEPDGQYVAIRQDFHRDLPSAAGRYRLDDFGAALAQAFRAGRTVVVPDVGAQGGLTSDERAAYEAIGIRAHATACLVKGGQLVALLGVRQTAPRAWTADDVALIEETAERAWAAIERAQAEERARTGEARLQLALSGARAGAWQWDLTTQRVIWSPEHYTLLGLSPQSSEHRLGTFGDVIHPDDRERMQAEFAAIMRRSGQFEVEFRVIRPDGAELWLRAVGHVECDAEGKPIAAMGISQDITARHRAEDRVLLLGEVSALLAGTLDEGPALNALARLLVRDLADWCLISTIEADGQVHRRAFAHIDPEREALLRNLPISYPYDPAQPYGAASVIASGVSRFNAGLTPEELARRSSRPPILPELQALGVASGMIVPLRARGLTFGAISLLRSNPARAFTEADLALAEQIADRAAVTLDSARLYAAERAARAAAERAAERQATLAEASRLFAAAGPALGSLLESIARYLVDLIGDGCLIGLVGDDGTQIELAAADHRDPDAAVYARNAFASTPMQVGLGVIGGAVNTGQPDLIPVVDRDTLLAGTEPELRPIIERYTPHSLMTAPCRAGGRTIGVISVARHTPDHPYTPADLDLLTDLADRAALAIARARLHDAEQLARSRGEAAQAQLALLAEAGIVLARSLDEEATLSALAALIVPAFADWCTINLIADDELRPPLAYHADPDRRAVLAELLRRYPATLHGEGPLARVMETREPLLMIAGADGLISEHIPDDDFLALLARVGLASTIIVPLVARERLLGALRFARVDLARPYGEDDVRLALELTRRAALALDNARLYRETSEAVAVRDRFLSIAAHELRTPVTSIRAYAQLVRRYQRRGDASPTLIENALTTIERGTTRLNSLIQDLLEVARLQSGQLRIERALLDLVALLATVAAEAQTQLPAGLRLTVANDAASYTILGDVGRLEQVLGNLLENARKYSPDGGLIAVSLATDERGATIAVRDEGIGLSHGEAQTIFIPFNRSEEALRRQIQGLGLGLAICRAIVVEHGGTLEATSAGYGQGTVFTLWLPAPMQIGANASDLERATRGAAGVEAQSGGEADSGGGG